MPELETVEPQKTAGFVTNSSTRAKRQAKLQKEEEELKALMEGKEVDATEAKQTEPEEVESKTAETPQKEDKLSAEEESFKKRYGDLRRHSQAKEKELTDKIEALEGRLKSETITPPKSDEDIAKWAEKYPDVAAIVETIAMKKAQEMSEGLNDRMKALDEQTAEVSRRKAEDTIRKAHSDFDTLRDDEKFHDWAEEQPKWVQDALYENADDPKSVIRVIDLYKMDNGMTKEVSVAKAKEAAKSVSPSTRTTVEDGGEKPTFKESQILKNSDAWFEKNYEAIMEAQREGRFIYDVSSAR